MLHDAFNDNHNIVGLVLLLTGLILSLILRFKIADIETDRESSGLKKNKHIQQKLSILYVFANWIFPVFFTVGLLLTIFGKLISNYFFAL